MPTMPFPLFLTLVVLSILVLAPFGGAAPSDDRTAQARITCPRLCFVGSADEIQYGEKWGGVLVSLAGPVIRERAQLEALGWDVRVLEGLDHTQAMQAAQVVPLLRSWLAQATTLPSA